MSQVRGVKRVMKVGRSVGAVVLLGLCACVSPQVASDSKALSRMSTADLWFEHLAETDVVRLSLIETRLYRMDEYWDDPDYLGRRTLAKAGQAIYRRASTSGAKQGPDCRAFPNAALAQERFLGLGGPVKDPMGLDPDGDGLACEWAICLEYARSTALAYLAALRKWEAIPQAEPKWVPVPFEDLLVLTIVPPHKIVYPPGYVKFTRPKPAPKPERC